METEHTSLNGRTWVELRVTARTHGLPFNTSIPKAASRAKLAAQLGTGGFARAIRRLTARERRGLLALQAAGGSMPRHRFTAHYGILRPVRQRQPLPAPPSTAEQLWRLGLIDLIPDAAGRGERVMLPPEVLALLPPLPRPRETPQPFPFAHTDAFSRPDFLGEMAAWLGAIMATAPRVMQGRWLSLRALRSINGRLFQPEPLDGIRSERDTGKLRLIHYLAEAAGLVALAGDVLTLTPTAWTWLDLPPESAWEALWSAVEQERACGGELWMRFRLPEIPPEVWSALVAQLGALPPGRYDAASFVEALRPFCPPDWDDDAGWDDEPVIPLPFRVESWLNAVFAPCGWARWLNGVVEIRRGDPTWSPVDTWSPLQIDDNAIHIHLFPSMPRRALVDILSITTMDESGLSGVRIDADVVERALERGVSALQIAAMLARVSGEPIPAAWLERLQVWERAARGVTIQRMTVITASDPALLDAMRADRRLRKWTAESLSAHHLVVQPGKAEAVAKTLRRKGVKVTHMPHRPRAARSQRSPASSLDTAQNAYGYLAAKIVCGLGDFIPLPFRVPSAARDEWAASLSPHTRDDLDRMAASVLDTLAHTLNGFPPPSSIQPEHPDAVRNAIRAAYDQRRAVTIEYVSPARGALTRRRIAPTRWYDLNGATYIEARCELDDAARTFRLDRVLRVLDESSDEPP